MMTSKMKLIAIGFAIIIPLLTTSCGPTYQTTYSYSPPEDALASTCTNQCESIQQRCIWNEEQRYQECESRATFNYNICESSKRYAYNYHKKRLDCVANCYCSKTYCPIADTEGCTQRHNSCYLSCGGTIVSTTQCVTNCEKAELPKTEILRGTNMQSK